MSEIKKILEIANAEVGYLEKASNSNLDDKIANAGDKNYTKYARDMDALNVYNGKKNGYAWCNIFIDWCFYKALGLDRAKELLIGFSAGCTQDYNWFKSKGQIVSEPQAGDLVFFGKTSHIGIIEKVENGRIYTIEGNTSNKAELIVNGGQVAKKSYSINSQYIHSFARPKYNSVAENIIANGQNTDENTDEQYTYKQFVGDVQKACGAKVDHIAGKETLSKTVTVSRYKNNRHAVVRAIQSYLNALGFDCGKVDGIAGKLFDNAVKSYQKANSCVVDGEITARNKTWKKLLKLA